MIDSRWSDIFNHLKNSGFDVYPPGVKGGECKTPYIVVKDAGSQDILTISSKRVLYDIMLYLPRNQYSQIEPYKKRVKESMDGLFPMIRPTNTETASYFDDTVKAWMASIQYQNYQKNTRR